MTGCFLPGRASFLGFLAQGGRKNKCQHLCQMGARWNFCVPQGETWRSEDRRFHPGCRAFTSGLRTFENVLEVVASERASAPLRHLQRNAVGPELVAETKVQTIAAVTRHSGAAWQWLPRLPSCECNSDEQFRSIPEIASTETRSRGGIASHRDNLYSCD